MMPQHPIPQGQLHGQQMQMGPQGMQGMMRVSRDLTHTVRFM